MTKFDVTSHIRMTYSPFLF